jgi:hypothetical protein
MPRTLIRSTRPAISDWMHPWLTEGQVAVGRLVRRFARIEPADQPTDNGRLKLRGLDGLTLLLG